MYARGKVVNLPPSKTSTKYLGINIDKSRDDLLSEQAKN